MLAAGWRVQVMGGMYSDRPEVCGGLFGQDQFAQGCQPQSVEGMAVFDLDLVCRAEQFGAAPATSRRCKGDFALYRPYRLARRPMHGCGWIGCAASTRHRSGRGRSHRVVAMVGRDGNNAGVPRQCAAARKGLSGFDPGHMVLEGLAHAVMALAATGCHRQLELQFVEAGAAPLRSASDVAVGDPVADANNHAGTVMRIVRISK